MNSDQRENCVSAAAYSIVVLAAFFLAVGMIWEMRSRTTPVPLGEDRAVFRHNILTNVLATDAEALNNPAYSWQDQPKGIVHLPIKDAMQLSLRLWQDPAAARSNLLSRAQKAFYEPPAPKTKFD